LTAGENDKTKSESLTSFFLQSPFIYCYLQLPTGSVTG